MTSEDRTMLWNATLGYPLFLAKVAREKALLDHMAEKVAFQDYILQRWEVADDSPVLERIYDRTDAEFLALDDELSKVAERSVGTWKDVAWLLRNAAFRSGIRSRLVRMRVAARLAWVALGTPLRFVWHMLRPSLPSAASTLAELEQAEAEWNEQRKTSLQFVEESEALGWYSPEKAAAERQRIYKRTQEIYERLRKVREACWLTE